MVRSYRRGAWVAVLACACVALAWVGLATSQTTKGQPMVKAIPRKKPAPNTSVPTSQELDQVLTVKENGKDLKCRVITTWRTENGAWAYQLQVVDTGEMLVVVEDGPATTIKSSGGRKPALSTKIFHWSRSNTPPHGTPIPPTMLMSGSPTPVNNRSQGSVILSEGPSYLVDVTPGSGPKTPPQQLTPGSPGSAGMADSTRPPTLLERIGLGKKSSGLPRDFSATPSYTSQGPVSMGHFPPGHQPAAYATGPLPITQTGQQSPIPQANGFSRPPRTFAQRWQSFWNNKEHPEQANKGAIFSTALPSGQTPASLAPNYAQSQTRDNPPPNSLTGSTGFVPSSQQKTFAQVGTNQPKSFGDKWRGFWNSKDQTDKKDQPTPVNGGFPTLPPGQTPASLAPLRPEAGTAQNNKPHARTGQGNRQDTKLPWETPTKTKTNTTGFPAGTVPPAGKSDDRKPAARYAATNPKSAGDRWRDFWKGKDQANNTPGNSPDGKSSNTLPPTQGAASTQDQKLPWESQPKTKATALPASTKPPTKGKSDDRKPAAGYAAANPPKSFGDRWRDFWKREQVDKSDKTATSTQGQEKSFPGNRPAFSTAMPKGNTAAALAPLPKTPAQQPTGVAQPDWHKGWGNPITGKNNQPGQTTLETAGTATKTPMPPAATDNKQDVLLNPERVGLSENKLPAAKAPVAPPPIQPVQAVPPVPPPPQTAQPAPPVHGVQKNAMADPQNPQLPPGAQSVLSAYNGIRPMIAYVPQPIVTMPGRTPPPPPAPDLPKAPDPAMFVNAFTPPPPKNPNPQGKAGQMTPAGIPGQSMAAPQAMVNPNMYHAYGQQYYPMNMAQAYAFNPAMMAQPLPPQYAYFPPGTQRPTAMVNYPTTYQGPLPPNLIAQARPAVVPVAYYGQPYMIPANYPMDRPQVVQGPDINHLLTVLRASPFPAQREMAAQSLAQCDWRNHPHILEAILITARTDPANSVRAGCCYLMAKMNMAVPSVMITLQALKADPDQWVRNEADKAWNQLNNVTASPPVRP